MQGISPVLESQTPGRRPRLELGLACLIAAAIFAGGCGGTLTALAPPPPPATPSPTPTSSPKRTPTTTPTHPPSPSPSPSPSSLPWPSPTPTPSPLVLTIPLAAAGVSMEIPRAIPRFGHFGDHGTFSVATNNAPAGTTVTLVSYQRHPAGAPPANHPGLGTIMWVRHTYSNTVTFKAFPKTDYFVFDWVGCSFVQDTFDGTTGTLLASQQPASVHGNPVDGIVVEFSSLAMPLTVVPGHTYWWELSASPFVSFGNC
jgi:hypothetical protein